MYCQANIKTGKSVHAQSFIFVYVHQSEECKNTAIQMSRTLLLLNSPDKRTATNGLADPNIRLQTTII